MMMMLAMMMIKIKMILSEPPTRLNKSAVSTAKCLRTVRWGRGATDCCGCYGCTFFQFTSARTELLMSTEWGGWEWTGLSAFLVAWPKCGNSNAWAATTTTLGIGQETRADALRVMLIVGTSIRITTYTCLAGTRMRRLFTIRRVKIAIIIFYYDLMWNEKNKTRNSNMKESQKWCEMPATHI